ncbi:MAG: inorganic phosphate transporter [Syntrophobacterales bacterium]|jgi:PiT family inorganic phosphate transporter
MWKVLSGVVLGWSLGANDSANIFGTGVTTGTVKYRTAILLTAAFVLLGSLIEGPKCIKTLGEISLLQPLDAFVCALATAITMGFLTFFALPASTSQAIVGAIVGAGILSGSADFSKLYKIVSCWVLAPIGGVIIAFVLHKSLGYLLDKTVTSIKHRNLVYTIGFLAAGSYGAYSLGGNNVANVTGVYVGAGVLSADMAALIGGLSIASGALTYSKKVMMTVGKGIAPLDPFSGLIAVIAGALTLHIFTQIGVPVSSSQAIVGAVVGVGIVGDVRTVNHKMLARITLGWLSTPICAGALTYFFVLLVT